MSPPPEFAELCTTPGCPEPGKHRHWTDPAHALASCLTDIEAGNQLRRGDLDILPEHWRWLVTSVEKRTHCQHCDSCRHNVVRD